jgi:hypothetical protein
MKRARRILNVVCVSVCERFNPVSISVWKRICESTTIMGIKAGDSQIIDHQPVSKHSGNMNEVRQALFVLGLVDGGKSACAVMRVPMHTQEPLE